MAVKTKQKEQEQPPQTRADAYDKSQILSSIWYSHRRDLLSSLLEDGNGYTLAEVDQKIKEFAERKVK